MFGCQKDNIFWNLVVKANVLSHLDLVSSSMFQLLSKALFQTISIVDAFDSMSLCSFLLVYRKSKL